MRKQMLCLMFVMAIMLSSCGTTQKYDSSEENSEVIKDTSVKEDLHDTESNLDTTENINVSENNTQNSLENTQDIVHVEDENVDEDKQDSTPSASTSTSNGNLEDEQLVTETIDYTALIAKYSGRWYLKGYSDIYIDISRIGNDESMNIEATGISLAGDVATENSYMLYPALTDVDDGWYHSNDIPFVSWEECLYNKKISLNETYITLGSYQFVKEIGSNDKYTGAFCKDALGTWFLDSNSNVQIIIEVCGENQHSGDLYSIETRNLDIDTLQYTKNDFRTIIAAKKSDWTNLGISVSNNKLVISNSYGTKNFYREVGDSSVLPTPENQPVGASGVTLSMTNLSLIVGSSQQLTAIVSPSNANNKNVIWASSDDSVAQVSSSGNVTAIGSGSVIISVITEDGGYIATCVVTVTEASSEAPVSDVLIISDTQILSNQTIDGDVYITSNGVVTFDNVIINGNIYCYGQLISKGCTANGIYAYAYGSMMSCSAFDGVHGKVNGSIDCNDMKITNDALDYAFNKWGKQ